MFNSQDCINDYNNENYIQAIHKYEKLILTETVLPKDLYNLGVCYTKIHDYQKSQECFKKAFDSGFNNSKCLFNLGYSCFKLCQYKSSLVWFKNALTLDPNDSECIEAIKILEKKLLPSKLEKQENVSMTPIKELTKKNVIPVIFYKEGTGFDVYIYVYDNDNNATETFIKSIECKRTDTKKYIKIKEGLLKKYKTKKIVLVA